MTRSSDAIIGFVEDVRGWRLLRSLAARLANTPSVPLVCEPEPLDADVDARALRTLVSPSRGELAQRGALVTAEVFAARQTERTRREDALVIDRQNPATLSDPCARYCP